MNISDEINLISTASNTAKTIAETLRILIPENPTKKNEYMLDEKVKEKILADSSIPLDDRLALVYGYSKIKKKFKNKKKVWDLAEEYFGRGKEVFAEKLEELDDDWLDFFSDKVENTNNEKIKVFWAKLLSSHLNNTEKKTELAISKKLISTLCLLEVEDISTFHSLCCMTFDSQDRGISKYPFIYVNENSSFLANCGVRRYHLASLDRLGLIEYNGPESSFALPKKTPKLKYHNIIIEFTTPDRVNSGNVRFTTEGRVLFDLTKNECMQGYIEACKMVWDEKGYKYRLEEI